ncbi:Leucyl aminopeptidase yscIV [Emydomyces testavorans]|uniref:Peptide hydrolase n=1 Tax=Emydomyces testavorans TaxID=2070801 RepID=A0AAF0DJL9_9EURO|nr:Leucyl aminopeptidase yscIV [Emydomyces testavorans]
MKTAGYLALGAVLASWVSAASLDDPALERGFPDPFKDLVDKDTLQNNIRLKDLEDGLQKLQSFADANGKTRVFGGPGHKATVDYLYGELMRTGYYQVTKQEHQQLWSHSNQSLTVNDKRYSSSAMTFSPSGRVKAGLVLANNVGCNAEDYPSNTEGKIVLIERGVCSFTEKNKNAFKAKAVGAIVYNNVPGRLRGTLDGAANQTVPMVGITQDDGRELAGLAKGNATAELFVETVQEYRTTWNVIAQTKGGDQNNVIMLGSHSDSVDAGPGINDNGSGTIGIFTIAKALVNYRVNNAVRFAWWTAEEFGLLGSEYYVAHLNDAEIRKIRLYLNFDMIGSPNYVNSIYDGDGSAYNMTGPPGSGEIEHLFEKYFDEKGWPHVPSAFTGRSDYAAFIQKNIPSGGLFTGAEVVKTPEQVRLFGGEAGKSYDPNYHQAGDRTDNIHKGAYLLNAKGAAYATAEYARSTRSLPPKANPPPPNRRRDGRKLKGYGGDAYKMCEHKACSY